MRLKFDPLSLALVWLGLSLGAGGADAAIANGAPHLIPSDSSSASSGELFLNVWDETAAFSYSLDLGTTVEELLSNPAGRTWSLDQRFKDFAAAGHPLRYNIAANNTYRGIPAPALGAVPSTYGVVGSVLNEAAAIALAEAFTGKAGTNIQQLSSPIQARVNTLNLSAAAANGLTPGSPSAMTDFASNLSEITDGSNDPYSAYFATLWGVNLSNRFAFSDAAIVRDGGGAQDQSLRLYFFGLQGPGVNKIKATDLGAGSLVATLDAANATLAWGAGGGGGGGTDPAACEQLPWAGAIQSGGTITAYSVAKSADCAAAAKTLTCDNGSLPGSDVYNLPSCVDTACGLPWGGSLASGQSVTAYQSGLSSSCVSEVRACTDGSLSGGFTYQSCTAPASCALPWGGTLADGQSVTAYRNKLDSDCAEGAETRTCANGKLSGSAINESCSTPFPKPTPNSDCGLPWGGALADGQSVTAYSTAVSADCGLAAETRACANGVLSGSFANPSCSAPPAPTEPYIQVVFPNGGEILGVGKKQTVRWNFGLMPYNKKVTVQFSKNGGGKWKLLKAGVKIDRTFNWKPTKAQVTETGLIQVCVPKTKQAKAVCGTSSASFAVRR